MTGLLSLSQRPQALRTALAVRLQEQPGTTLCWQAGQQADTPGTAFFIGYQTALRCLDPALPPDVWAAFCVSEQGVRDPFALTTAYHPADGWLTGRKSHVMLPGRGLDRLYIVAREQGSEPVELLLLRLDAGAVDVEVGKAQPFLPDVPHQPVHFACTVAADAVLLRDAHRRANKPFRYWEDVHVTLAQAGWLAARLPAKDALALLVAELQTHFAQHPVAYCLAGLDAVERLQARMLTVTSQLTAADAAVWQRDSVLLRLTQPLRDQIRARLSR